VSASRPARDIPRFALTPNEAAAALGVSRDFFDEHISPELRVIRRGRRKLVPVSEIARWVEANASLTLLGRDRS
jgi:excisionase family DNA binding protein